jgi:hypothetical protein
MPVLATFSIRTVRKQKSGCINEQIDVAAFYFCRVFWQTFMNFIHLGYYFSRSGIQKIPAIDSQAHFLVAPPAFFSGSWTGAGIAVVQTLQERGHAQGLPFPFFYDDRAVMRSGWNFLANTLMWARCIVVLGVFLHHIPQLSFMEDKQGTEAFAFDTPHQTFTMPMACGV